MADRPKHLASRPKEYEVYDVFPDGIACFDLVNRLVYANPALTRLLNWPGSALKGRVAGASVLELPPAMVRGGEFGWSENPVRRISSRLINELQPSGLRAMLYTDVTALSQSNSLIAHLTERPEPKTGPAFFEAMIAKLTELCGTSFGLMGEFGMENNDLLKIHSFFPQPECRGRNHFLGPRALSELQAGRPCFWDAKDCVSFPRDGWFGRRRLKTCWLVPLRNSGGVSMGAVGVMDQQAHELKRDQRLLLEHYAERISMELERYRAVDINAGYLEYLANLHCVTHAMSSSLDLGVALDQGIDEMRKVFDCDRAWLLYPCDPEATSCDLLYLSETSRHGGARALTSLPVDAFLADCFTESLAVNKPVSFLCEHAKSPELYGCSSKDSLLLMALRPHMGPPWLLGIQAGRLRRPWTLLERNLFREIAAKVKDALNALLYHREAEVSENRYRAVLNDVREVIFRTDREFRFTFLNPAWQKLSGLTLEAGLGRAIWKWFRGEDQISFRQACVRIMEGRREFEELQCGLVTVADGIRWVALRIWPGYDERGRVQGLSGVMADITEKQRALSALEASESRYRELVELSPLAMAMHVEGILVFINDAAVHLFGAASREQILGRSVFDFVPPLPRGDSDGEKRDGERRDQGPPATAADYTERPLRRLDGQTFSAEVMSLPVTFQGKPAVQLLAHDLSERRRAAEALRKSEERYALAARGANDGLWDWDLEKDQVYYSPRFTSLLGFVKEPVGSSPKFWLDRIHPQDREPFEAALQAHLENPDSFWELEHRLRHRNGAYRWMSCRGVAEFDTRGKPLRMAGSLQDITERKKTEDQLIHQALHDPLTGLDNRALFLEHLKLSLDRGKHARRFLVAVLLLNFDRFKMINDSLGHLVGDQLLLAFSKRLGALLPSGCLFARLNGDEFVVMLEKLKRPGQALRLAERIHRSLKHPFVLEDRDIFTGVSLGIALGHGGEKDPEALLRDAGTAMHRAKLLGKSRHVLFKPAMRESVQGRFRLETQLRKAVEKEDFDLCYQPIVDLERERVIGFEALLRWFRDEQQPVEPERFISLAEETDLILPLGQMALREACEQTQKWQGRFGGDEPLSMHVNISARQLSQPDFLMILDHILKETGLSPRQLKLEITETNLLEHLVVSGRVLHKLKYRGIGLCLDDFGTGYSSLSYLSKLPVDMLKIDKSFVAAIETDQEIVTAILRLARGMKREVVAEGVETPAQLALLKRLGCRYVQGYLFSKPLSVAQAGDLLAMGGLPKNCWSLPAVP